MLVVPVSPRRHTTGLVLANPQRRRIFGKGFLRKLKLKVLARFPLQGERNCLHINCSRSGYWPPASPALLDINPHGLKKGGFSGLDGVAQTVNARKILAVCKIFSPFTFDSDRVSV
jgi:hypothetical protein